MLTTPIVSVIIPTFNRAEYLEMALQSVIAQTYLQHETIIVDDGSTDGTEACVRKYRHLLRLRYFYQPNKGRAAARNTGMQLANGRWILFLDSDDVLLPEALTNLVETTSRTECRMIVGQVEFFGPSGEIWQPITKELPSGLIYPSLIRECTISMGSYLICKPCAESSGLFDSSLEPCEDYDYHLRFALRYPILAIKVPVARIRRHDMNTSSANIRIGIIKVARKQLRILAQSEALPRSVMARAAVDLTLSIADSYYILGNSRDALKSYLRAIHLSPRLVFDFHLVRQIAASLVPKAARRIVKRMIAQTRNSRLESL